jgi:hypothetical protein
MQFELRARGPAPADLAWRRYRVFAEWPTWSPQIRRVESDTDHLAPGVTGKVIGPLGVPVDFRIDEVDEAARTWSWQVTTVGIRLRLHHTVETDGAGSRTTLHVNGCAPIVLGYAPLAQIALHRLVTLPDRTQV